MIRTQYRLFWDFKGADGLRYGVIAAWVLAMISLPIARWVWGDSAITWGVFFAALMQVLAVAVILAGDWGRRRTVQVMLVVGVLTTLAEIIGSRTGVPFGYYHYTDALQPQFANVPLLIPLAWFMMLPPAWAVAQAAVGHGSRWAFIGVSALALTAWDLFLDPQKVAWGFWVWTDSTRTALYSGGYFGVPWLNYLGWLLVASLVTGLVRPQPLSVRPLLVIYAIVWLFQAMGQSIFWGQPGPALVGFVGMGSLLAWACWGQRSLIWR